MFSLTMTIVLQCFTFTWTSKTYTGNRMVTTKRDICLATKPILIQCFTSKWLHKVRDIAANFVFPVYSLPLKYFKYFPFIYDYEYGNLVITWFNCSQHFFYRGQMRCHMTFTISVFVKQDILYTSKSVTYCMMICV